MDNEIKDNNQGAINKDETTNTLNIKDAIGDLFKLYINSSKNNFNSRFNKLLLYVKSKKIDDQSYVIDNDYIDFNSLTNYEALSSIDKCKLLNKDSDYKKEIESNCNIIIDLNSFLISNIVSSSVFDSIRLDYYLNQLKNLGVAILLVDIKFIISFESFLKEQLNKNPNINYLIKCVIAHKSPFISFFYIQKFVLKNPVKYENIKVHLAETIERSKFDENININKINDLSFPEMTRAYEHMFIINEMSSYLRKVKL